MIQLTTVNENGHRDDVARASRPRKKQVDTSALEPLEASPA